MTHAEIDNLLEFDGIRSFLDDLSRHLELRDGKLRESAQPGDIEELQRKVLLGGEGSGTICEEEYGDDLSEHVVSSSAFSSRTVAGKFLHYYDRTTRSRVSNQAGSRHLVKEARKCFKILPKPHAHSSCFVCFAEERMDLCRAIVTGPVGTPYAHGIFVFDIYFPPMYPSVPPLVTFMTTGGGTVRFSPNLIVDGKVCLSILDLTFAQGESQRWNPEQSSLAQVLMSIQAQIFDVKEPYFNEGSGIPPEQRNTPAGREGSRKHNAVLRLATLRHAVAAHLRSPPLGFEDVTRRHFSMCRRRLLVQARRWMIEGRENPSSFRRFERAYGELVRLMVPLADLDGGGRSLPPLEEDAAIVRADDWRFPGIYARIDDDGGEPMALSIGDSATANAPAFNPWAGPPTRVESNTSDISEDDPDDDMYI
jgi:baculoviral IAP repeat-containing protein 6